MSMNVLAQEINSWIANPVNVTWKVRATDHRQKDPAVTCEYIVKGVNLTRDDDAPGKTHPANGVFGTDPDGNTWFIPMTRRNLLTLYFELRDDEPNSPWNPDLFRGFIFFGYGPEVKQQVLELHKQVEFVLSVNSGAQQGPYWTKVTGPDGTEAWEDELLNKRDLTIRSIVLAMMGGHLLKVQGEDTGPDTGAGRRPPADV